MAWLTNPELFDILQKKASEYVKIFLIISDQPDNEKLDFESLSRIAVKFNRIKNIGYNECEHQLNSVDLQKNLSADFAQTNI